MFRSTVLAGTLLVLGASVLAGSASGMPIVHVNPGNNTIAISIDDLEVTSEGETLVFDVTFLCLTFTQFQATGGALIYDGGLPNSAELWAENVQAAIAAALNAYNAASDPDVELAGVNGAESSPVIFLPFADSAAPGSVEVERSFYDGTDWGTAGNLDVPVEQEAVYATLQVVPEPSSALLLGFGLVGASFVRARTRRSR